MGELKCPLMDKEVKGFKCNNPSIERQIEDSYFINQFSHRDTFNIKDEYYEKKGYAHYKLGEYEEAIDDYTKAIELNVDKYRYYDKRGAANYRLEKYKEAANDYARAISILESIK